MGLSGNALFLAQVLRELKNGHVRAQPNFPRQAAGAALAAVILLIGWELIQSNLQPSPDQSAENAGSYSAPSVNSAESTRQSLCSNSNVLQAVRELGAKPKPEAELLPPEARQAFALNPSDILMSDITTESQGGNRFVCSAFFQINRTLPFEEEALRGADPQARELYIKQRRAKQRISYTVQMTDNGRFYVELQP